MVRSILFLAVVTLAAPAFSGEPALAAPESLAYYADLDNLFAKIGQGNIGLAIEDLQKLVGSADSEERWASFRKELTGIAARSEDYDGWELAAIRRLSPRMHMVYCLAHYRQGPVLFIFQMRLFRGQWTAHSVNFTINLDEFRGGIPLECFSAAQPPATAPEAATAAPAAL